MGVKEGIDPQKLDETGWGVIFPTYAASDPDKEKKDKHVYAIREALQPLLEMRQAQTGGSYRQFTDGDGYRAGETETAFLARHGMGPGLVNPDKVPYYLLLVGDFEAIPYRFQRLLDLEYVVGRIHFDTLDEYAAYARSVVMAETEQVKLARRATFFGVANPDDPVTKRGVTQLVEPLARVLKQNDSRWDIQTILADAATKARLASLLGGSETPALLFASGHGMGFPITDPRQLAHQGALLCQDWPGPAVWPQAIPQGFYFASDDIINDASLLGSIAFLHASYSAGMGPEEEFAGQRQPRTGRGVIEVRPVLARLPQRLLGHPRGGMLAVVGWVDRLWSSSFDWPKAAQQIAVYESITQQLLDGYSIGRALKNFNMIYAELSMLLSAILQAIRRGERLDPVELARVWAYNSDMRNYVLIGDPAVRLPVAETHEGQPRPMLIVTPPQPGSPEGGVEETSAPPSLVDLGARQQQLRQELDAVVADDRPELLPRLVQIALEFVRSHDERLWLESAFDLARRGEVSLVVELLNGLALEANWRHMVRLVTAWLAGEAQADSTRWLLDQRDSEIAGLAPDDPRRRLAQRIRADLEGTPFPLQGLPPAPTEDALRDMLASNDSELLSASLERETIYTDSGPMLSSSQGSALVAFIAANPQAGERYWQEYLAQHAANGYSVYRRASLWELLRAVLQHPDQGWVKAKICELALVALDAGDMGFQETLPLTVLALRANAGAADASEALQVHLAQTGVESSRLAFDRAGNDLWARHRRLLAAYAQLAACQLLNNGPASEDWLSRALALPFGLAGFEAPAYLTLAEAILVCHPAQEGDWTEQALQAAQQAAHNIADPTFLARTTARVDAFRSRWWPAPIRELQQQVTAMRSNPQAAQFAALHTVGQRYERRAVGSIQLPLPDRLLTANTLAALVEMYQCSLAEFQHLNPHFRPNEPLPPGTAVNVPDPELAPLLAARLAAEALAAPNLAAHERLALIRPLVSVAITAPTALDTVLSRLLLAEKPADSSTLDALAALLPPLGVTKAAGGDELPEDSLALARWLAVEAEAKVQSQDPNAIAVGALLAIESLRRTRATREGQRAWAKVLERFPPVRTSLSYEPAKRLSNNHNRRASLALSDDGDHVAVVTSYHVRIWKLSTGALVFELAPPASDVSAIALGPGGLLLATAGQQGTIRLWNVASHVTVAELHGQSRVQALAFSADGQKLAAGLFSDLALVWDIKSQHLIAKLSHSTGEVFGVALSENGLWLATIGWHHQIEENVGRAWTVSQGSDATGYTNVRGYIKGDVTAIALNSSGEVLATGGLDHAVEVWALRKQPNDGKQGPPPTLEKLISLTVHPAITGLALNREGKLVAVATANGVDIWDYTARKVVASVDHKEACLAAFVEGDQRLVTVSENLAQVWDMAYGKEMENKLQRSTEPLADADEILRQIPEICRRVGRNLTPDEWRSYIGPDEPYRQTCPERSTIAPETIVSEESS